MKITTEEYNRLSDQIYEDCSTLDSRYQSIASHRQWLLGILNALYNGNKPDYIPEQDAGKDLCGLDEYLN